LAGAGGTYPDIVKERVVYKDEAWVHNVIDLCMGKTCWTGPHHSKERRR